jgi:response regulator RpfG family c-di-GMP phosphodiesterase
MRQKKKNKSDKILVAKDYEVSNPITLGLLNQKGFSKISQPKNGSIVLCKLYLNQVSIIISEGRMLDMDGLEFHKSSKGRSN